MGGYLFVHFVGEQEDGEQIYFSLSKEGLVWKDLNEGKPILCSRIGEKGVRDPFPIKDERTGKYYIIATDLRIASGKGWSSAQNEGSLNLIVWESEDLVHWSEERSHRVGIDGAGCVWAPEAIYDNEKEAFLVFFASKTPSKEEYSKHKIYAVYTQNFRTFSEPFLYIEREKDVIDTTIIQHNGFYYRFSKDETTSRIKCDFSNCLTGANFKEISSKILDKLVGVEGPECFLLPDGNQWCLLVDRFAEGKGYLPLITNDLQSGEWKILSDDMYDLGKTKKRHGGILKLIDQEYETMRKAFNL